MKKRTKIGLFLLIAGILLLQIPAISALANEISIGTTSYGIAFDGANIWVTDHGSKTVTKLRASDGALVGTYAVGTQPFGFAFDGANIWVANYGGDTVTKLRASDGALLGTYAVGTQPYGIAFDGANIW
jgi:DNA-binding beta-propeller fold protein YncE